jgi:hypothetical protein
MTLKYLENQGSGNILEIGKQRLLELAPRVYPATWQAMLSGEGDYVVILGAGFAEREVFFGLEEGNLDRNRLPSIHCYDIAKKPHSKFLQRREEFPQVNIEYFGDKDLNELQLPEYYANNTRLVSMHGVLDYLLPQSISILLSQVTKLRPQTISIRLLLIGDEWSIHFATPEQLETERSSVRKLERGTVSPIDAETFRAKGIVQLSIPVEAKRQHNLRADYPASHILPDRLAGYLLKEGYELTAVDQYSLTPADLAEEETSATKLAESNEASQNPDALLMFLQLA